jgi:hypothetical protein
MRTVKIDIGRTKDFLADRLVHNILQEDEKTLIHIVRHEGLGGFDKMSDSEIFTQLVEIFPEFELIYLADTIPGYLIVGVKEEHMEQEEDILVDIVRIIQMKF